MTARTDSAAPATARTNGGDPMPTILKRPEMKINAALENVRLDRSNEKPLDYYIFPSIDMNTTRIRMAEDNALSLDAYRFSSLDFFYSMAARTSFQEAA